MSKPRKQPQTGGDLRTTFASLGTFFKNVQPYISTTITTLNKVTNETSQCYQNYRNKAIAYLIPYFLTFFILPTIVIITSIVYIVDASIKLASSSKADFYEDLLNCNSMTSMQKIPFAGFFISSYTLTFLIITILAICCGIAMFVMYKEIQSSCGFFTGDMSKTFSTLNMMWYFLAFYSAITIIIITDILINKSFYDNVGNNMEKFNQIIDERIIKPASNDDSYQKSINLNTATLGQIIEANTWKALDAYVTTQINEITKIRPEINPDNATDNDMKNIKQDPSQPIYQHYQNIINAYLTFHIIKTISDNGYHTSTNRTGQTNFFTAKNLYLSIRSSDNMLINADFSKPNAITLQDYVLKDCSLIKSDVDTYVMNMKNSMDQNSSAKIGFIVALGIITFITTGFIGYNIYKASKTPIISAI